MYAAFMGLEKANNRMDLGVQWDALKLDDIGDQKMVIYHFSESQKIPQYKQPYLCYKQIEHSFWEEIKDCNVVLLQFTSENNHSEYYEKS